MTNAVSTVAMTKEEWLESRRKGIGGSDVSSILGFNQYKSALDLYFEKISEEKPSEQMNAKMKAGLILEDVVANWFVEETGLRIQRDNKIRIHSEHPFLIANIDRLILSNNGDGPGVLEIKTTSGFVAKQWEDGDVPLTYFAQLQHYLSVTGYSYGYFGVLVDGWDFRCFRQERDEEFIRMMNDRLFQFWKQVESRIPPEPSTREDIKRLYPSHSEGLTLEATQETYDAYLRLCEIRAAMKELETNEEELLKSIQLVMKDAEILEHEGKRLATWKQSKDSSRFEAKLFQKDHPDLYNTYTITVPGCRRFLIKQ